MRRPVPLLLFVLACASTGRVSDPLLERPYVWASAGQVELLTCRWSGDAPVGVALASDASASEEHVLDAVLASLADAAPGLRFLRVQGVGGASITVRFVDAAVPRADGTLGTSRSVTDCQLGASGAHAALVEASIELARSTPPDRGGRTRPLAPEELAAALLAELGQALGVAGRAEDPDDPLAAAPDAALRAGRRALAGEAVVSASLAALYARPSGAVLARQPVDPARTQEIDRLAVLAAAHGLDGPRLRASDTGGRIFWRDAAGREWGFLVPNLARLSRDPSTLLLVPEAATRAALPRRVR